MSDLITDELPLQLLNEVVEWYSAATQVLADELIAALEPLDVSTITLRKRRSLLKLAGKLDISYAMSLFLSSSHKEDLEKIKREYLLNADRTWLQDIQYNKVDLVKTLKLQNKDIAEGIEQLKEFVQETILDKNKFYINLLKQEVLGDITTTAPEAPPDAPLEKFAFADQRTDTPEEENTEVENDILQALDGHITSDVKLSANTASIIQKMVADGQYDNMLSLNAAQHPIIYRGMSVGAFTLAQLLDVEETDIQKMLNSDKSIIIKKNLTAKPRSATASWSTNYDIAVDFARSTQGSLRQVMIVLYARAKDNPGNFIINPETTRKVDKLKEYAHEHETIGVGPIDVYQVEILAHGRAKQQPK